MQKKPTMIVGQKGVKYGLQTRQPASASRQPAGGRLNAFADDSDSDEDIGQQVQRQAARKVADSKVQEMYAAALAEDPTAFDYDGVYDSMQEEKAVPKQREKVSRQPKYIASLLEQAAVRKREQEITFERQLLKERQKEDHMYENQEKFVTSAYRRKLEEDKKWQESQRLKELEEEQNDVRKLGHMNNFFHNLTKNVALGGQGAAGPTTTAAAEQQHSPAAAAAGEQQPSPEHVAGHSHKRRGSYDGEEEMQVPAASSQRLLQEEQEQSPHGGQQQPAQHKPQQQQEQQQVPNDRGSPQPQQQGGKLALHPADAAAGPGMEQQQQQQHPAAVGGKRKNDDAAVAAARERYLARKRQQQGGA